MATHETQSRMEPRRRRAERRRRPPLLVIVLAGLAAVTVAFLVARAIDEERPHGPYLIGAWTFGDRSSLQRAVDAEAIDEVSVDWLQSRADGGLEAPKYDAGFISLARKQDCRVFVTLTDYDDPGECEEPPSPRHGSRRLVPRASRRRRGRRLGSGQG